ncbi:MAG: AAA family ATPase [Betaproteobacteria bacterium]|nr:AAA family ATPase [Betaproteobacteria bacterium]
MNDERDLTLIIRSRFPIVAIETHEELRALALLERVARLEQHGLFVWCAADGMQRRDNPFAAAPGHYSVSSTQKEPYGKGPIADTLNIGGALKHIHATSFKGIYVLVDVHPYLEDPVHQRLLKSIAQDYDRNPRTLVLLGPSVTLPADLQRLTARFELKMPDLRAMRELIESESKNAIRFGSAGPNDDTDAVAVISQHLVGLCLEDARRLVRQCLTDDGCITPEDVPRVLKAKQASLGSDGSVVQVELGAARMSDVAGLAKLKRWLTQRRAAFIGDAQALGLDPPKGVLLLGVQGGGKSLAAKAVAGTWQLPLLRLDFGSLYDKWLGETERKLREALKFADTMAPCVLWMDEIEKGVAAGGASDGGESRRVLGTLLTWMAERKSKVFMVATANDIEHLPPELIRKGRFDEIFFVDLPDAETRAEIFKLHLMRRNLNAAKFDLAKLANASDGFSGAEIEQAIVSGLYEAHAQNTPLNTMHVLTEIVRTRPLSVVMAEKIDALRQWAAQRTVSAN